MAVTCEQSCCLGKLKHYLLGNAEHVCMHCGMTSVLCIGGVIPERCHCRCGDRGHRCCSADGSCQYSLRRTKCVSIRGATLGLFASREDRL